MSVDEPDPAAHVERRGAARPEEPARELESLLRASELEQARGEYLLFFPWRARLLRAAERNLTWLPLGAQYVVAARRGA